jgi:NtrC-family two-component system sensor histidine kinase KinB
MARWKEAKIMSPRSLRTRFLLAGVLLVALMAACGAWSVVTFARLSAVIGDTLRDSQEKIDLTATLASGLEREDNALLLSLTGDAGRARGEREEERRRFEEAFARLRAVLTAGDEQAASDDLRRHVDAYRRAGNALLSACRPADARETYHERVNPALRKAVADCGRLRELSFRAMRHAGIEANNQAQRATHILAVLALAALICVTAVAMHLAWTILRPIRELTRGVESIRKDDFSHRVRVHSPDELGQLAQGFNRMAETLTEYRNSSLGELLLAKTILESTLAVLPDAVILVDAEGRIEAKNTPAKAVLRAAEAGEAGRLQELPLPAGVLQAVDETLRGERPGVRPDPSQALTVWVDGCPLRMLVTVAPLPSPQPSTPRGRGQGEGTRRGAVIVLADVTDFARLDELRSELVAVASHELKTPLTSLRMNLLLLRERGDNLTPRQTEILTAAVQAAEELASTIEELLDLTRIEAGQLRLQREPVDLDALAEQVVRALRPRFEDAAIRLRIVHEAPSAFVRGDAARLRIVFVNLLDNALKYTPTGGEVEVRLSCTGDAPPEGPHHLRILVADTGPGVPAVYRERIFEKFFRVEHHQDEQTQGVHGAGIGLYLCRQIVEAHGGSIRCEAGADGRGTRFLIDLPTQNSSEAEA